MTVKLSVLKGLNLKFNLQDEIEANEVGLSQHSQKSDWEC